MSQSLVAQESSRRLTSFAFSTPSCPSRMDANPSEVLGPTGATGGQEQTDDQRQAALANGASHDSRVSEDRSGRRVTKTHARGG